MITITIDGQRYQVNEAHNLLQASLSVGLDLPYFCWHPAMGSVGACRQCAVKQYRDQDDEQGTLVMACMCALAEGARFAIEEPEAQTFRRQVVEWLMLNHPHDCPVCEAGSECHLQDMTHMTGHLYRQLPHPKRTFRNQDLGPHIGHEMNRCITCYRCTRFYRDYAGGDDLHEQASRNRVYFGRSEEGTLESPFSGNLAEVCPTGVFFDKTYSEHYVRKWDLQQGPAICHHCALGCNISPGERDGTLRRVVNRYHQNVNGYFLCDRGRFGYGFVNADTRLRYPVVKGNSEQDLTALLPELAAQLQRGRVAGIGSPRASLESNFALAELVGKAQFYDGLDPTEARLIALVRDALARAPKIPTLGEVALADAVIILGEDVTATAPLLHLKLRQAAFGRAREIAAEQGLPPWRDDAVADAGRGERHPIFIATPYATDSDPIARATLRGAPEQIAQVGAGLLAWLNEAAPPEGLSEAQQAFIAAAGEALTAARRPLVISGYGLRDVAVLTAAIALTEALTEHNEAARGFYTVPECNSLGLALMAPQPLERLIAAAQRQEVDTVIVVENDLYRRATNQQVEALLANVQVVVLDHTLTPTAQAAAVALPSATFADGSGTLVNNEGRAQRFFKTLAPNAPIQESWRWLNKLLTLTRDGLTWYHLDEVIAQMAQAYPALVGVKSAAPGDEFRVVGQKIPRQSYRASGRTALHAHEQLHERQPPEDSDAPLAFSMEGYYGPQTPAALIPFFWAPRWSSYESLHKFQEEAAGALLQGDAGSRLLEGEVAAPKAEALAPLEPFLLQSQRLRLVPRWQVFGSEEQSSYSSYIQARTPQAAVALNPDEAAARQLLAGERVALADPDKEAIHWRLPLQLDPSLPSGVAAVTLTGGITPPTLPRWVHLAKEEAL